MAIFLNDLPQDKKTKMTWDNKHITDKLGSYVTTYTSQVSDIKLIISPITTTEKNALIEHYKTNRIEPIDLVVNAYNTGTIIVYYKKAPTFKIKGKIHWEATCEFRG